MRGSAPMAMALFAVAAVPTLLIWSTWGAMPVAPREGRAPSVGREVVPTTPKNERHGTPVVKVREQTRTGTPQAKSRTAPDKTRRAGKHVPAQAATPRSHKPDRSSSARNRERTPTEAGAATATAVRRAR